MGRDAREHFWNSNVILFFYKIKGAVYSLLFKSYDFKRDKVGNN